LTEEQRLALIRIKTQDSVFGLIYYLKTKGQPPITNWGNFVHDGKAEVQVWLTAKSDAARMKLKELGFEVVLDSSTSTLIIGRLPIDKLELLAQFEFVRYVSPQIWK
jgi:hypothetical protein